MFKADDSIKEKVEEQLAELPIVQYAWMRIEDLVFSDRVRQICMEECPRYGKSWSCPPAVGTVEECRRVCESYQGAFVFSTIAEVQDAANMEETLATRGGHESVTRKVREILRQYFPRTMALSSESCAVCDSCAYPEAGCRCPDQMIPCVEGYGIVVVSVAERAGIEFMNEGNLVTWFGIVLFG